MLSRVLNDSSSFFFDIRVLFVLVFSRIDLFKWFLKHRSLYNVLVCVPPPPGMKRRGGGAKAREAGGEEEEAEEEEVEEEAAAEDEEEAAATAAAAAAAEDKEDEKDEEEEEEREEREEEGLVGQKERAEGEERDEEEEESSTRGGGVVLADTLPVVSEQEARTALLNLVAEHCCWGKAAARNMNITKIASTSAFHVITTRHVTLHLSVNSTCTFELRCRLSSFLYFSYVIPYGQVI